MEDKFEGKNWSEILTEIRDSLEADNSELLWRFDELTELRGTLLDYIEAIEATLLSFDPEDDYFEAAFGDVGMLRTIQLLCSLHMIPGRIDDLMGEERAAVWRAEQEERHNQSKEEGNNRGAY